MPKWLRGESERERCLIGARGVVLILKCMDTMKTAFHTSTILSWEIDADVEPHVIVDRRVTLRENLLDRSKR